MPLTHLLSVARGETPADLLLKNGRILNVFTGEIEPGDIAIADGKIAGIGRDYSAAQTIDLKNAYVAPGLIDAHVHIDSRLCRPAQFAAAVVPRGVTTVVADPHEIANVAGAEGVRFMSHAARGLALNVILMAPSCVPATDFATSGATLGAEELAQLLNDKIVHGLAEVMNYPGAIGGNASVLSKISAFTGRPIDGHAPSVTGKHLNAYVATGIGSDHECVTVEEAREKLSRGLYILIREATNAHNLDALLPLITPKTARRICFCTDDRQPADLLAEGSIDHMIRRAIAFGIDPVTAFLMATLNPTEWFNLHDRGAIAPGRVADLMIFDDLKNPQAKMVLAAGKIVAENGKPRDDAIKTRVNIPQSLSRTVKINASAIDFAITARPGKLRVIESQANQLVTGISLIEPTTRDGNIVTDPSKDVLKIAVIERHAATGRVGIGFIRGFGLKRGAIAGTVAHDHHNLIVIGVDDRSMLTATKTLQSINGGYAVTDADKILATLALPIAGLMSAEPIEQVAREYDHLRAAARTLGATPEDPFMAMSFMALEVIPKLKLTDKGLIDVESFKHVELFA